MDERSEIQALEHPSGSVATTEGIRVQAIGRLDAERSDPDRNHYHYDYKITIRNVGDEPAKLIARHWVILDSINRREEVRGPGVVGKNPELQPGEVFEYLSSCPLRTEWGTMEGSYVMRRPDGREFEAKVARFFLVPSAPPIDAPNGE